MHPRYDGLKQELLNNDICCIDAESWEREHAHATIRLSEDERVKQLRANDIFWSKYYIAPGVAVTLQHVLAILFYCNTDALQKALDARSDSNARGAA